MDVPKSRDKMIKDLIGLVYMSFKYMSYKELEKTYNETFEKISKKLEHDLVYGKEDQDG